MKDLTLIDKTDDQGDYLEVEAYPTFLAFIANDNEDNEAIRVNVEKEGLIKLRAHIDEFLGLKQPQEESAMAEMRKQLFDLGNGLHLRMDTIDAKTKEAVDELQKRINKLAVKMSNFIELEYHRALYEGILKCSKEVYKEKE